MSDAYYIPGALSAFLNKEKEGVAETSPSPKKKRKSENTVGLSGKSALLFEESCKTAVTPVLPAGRTTIQKKDAEIEDLDEAGDSSLATRNENVIQPGARRKGYPRIEDEKIAAAEKKRTIFVGNAPTTATRKAIKKLFSKFGQVESVRLRSFIAGGEKMSKKVAALKSKFSSKTKCLHFYVKFREESCAEKALTMNGTKLENHMLRVDSCSAKKEYDCKMTVFVGNIPYDAQEDGLAEHFAKAGKVKFVRIVRDSRTGIGKGFAFVGFEESAAVSVALGMNNLTFQKRELRVTRIQKRNKRPVQSSRGATLKKSSSAEKNFVNEIKVKKSLVTNHKRPIRGGDDSVGLKKSVRQIIKKRRSRRIKKSIML